jgi:hypothetical protein
MVRDILNSVAVGKLKGIVKSRYGRDLTLNFMQEVSSLNIEEDTFLLSRGDLHVPIKVDSKFFATAVVERGAALESEEQETLSDLIRLMLEPEFLGWYTNQMIHNSHQTSVQANSNQVISIFEPFQLVDSVPAFQGDDAKKTEAKLSSTNVICVQTPNPNLIPRIAHEIHDVSKRWAFLNFSDVAAEIKTVEDIRTLGSLTLWIEDILNLNPEQQALIHQFVSDSSPADEPLLVIGSSSSLESLEERKMIHTGLVKILKIHRLEVDRLPRDPKLLQETLEFMLEF